MLPWKLTVYSVLFFTQLVESPRKATAQDTLVEHTMKAFQTLPEGIFATCFLG
jgi:alpha-ketoglutarate-dependent taurine dioxygenase